MDTIPGGRYVNTAGFWINSDGHYIDFDGNEADEPVKAETPADVKPVKLTK